MAVYGIDFGTCNSCIAVAEDDGTLAIIPSSRNETTMPSVVMFNLKRMENLSLEQPQKMVLVGLIPEMLWHLPRQSWIVN